jgi:sugar phosphate permease
VAGALARLAAGWWSDRRAERLRPMRRIVVAAAAALALLAVAASAGTPLAVAALLLAGVLAVSPNGLAFTAVAERAGPGWAGRALGIQNTVQNLAGAATAPIMAAVIAGSGYRAAFAAVVAFPLLAAAVIPRSGPP